MGNFLGLKKGLEDFANASMKKTEQLKKKKQELTDLNQLPLPREDVAAGICRMLDVQAKRYPERLTQMLAGVVADPSFDFENSQLDLISNSGASCQPGALPKQNALWFFGEQIKNRITDAIMEMDYPEAGLPTNKRQPLIMKLTKEIETLESEAQELQQQAADLGIKIPSPVTAREEKIVFTEKVRELVKTTPYPNHTVRQMLLDGLNPLEEMKKIKSAPKPPSPSATPKRRGLISEVRLN